MNLIRHTICPVALAFVLWRMSTEGIANVDGLSSEKVGHKSLRLKDTDFCEDLSDWDRVRFAYVGFFGVCWTVLRALHSLEKIIFCVGPEPNFTNLVVHRPARTDSENRCEGDFIYVLYPQLPPRFAYPCNEISKNLSVFEKKELLAEKDILLHANDKSRATPTKSNFSLWNLAADANLRFETAWCSEEIKSRGLMCIVNEYTLNHEADYEKVWLHAVLLLAIHKYQVQDVLERIHRDAHNKKYFITL